MKFWGWLLQRITGLALVILLAIHIYLSYFSNSGHEITFNLVSGRIHSSVFWVDLLLLYSALFHGLYGLNVVLSDLLPQCRKCIVYGLGAIGLVLAYSGTMTLVRIVTA